MVVHITRKFITHQSWTSTLLQGKREDLIQNFVMLRVCNLSGQTEAFTSKRAISVVMVRRDVEQPSFTSWCLLDCVWK